MSNETKHTFTIDQLRRFCEVYQNWWWEHPDPNPKWEEFMGSEDAFDFFQQSKQKP